jgi:hypothetical protein
MTNTVNLGAGGLRPFRFADPRGIMDHEKSAVENTIFMFPRYFCTSEQKVKSWWLQCAGLVIL